MLHELPNGTSIDLLTIKAIRPLDRAKSQFQENLEFSSRVIVDYLPATSRWGNDTLYTSIVPFETFDAAKQYARELTGLHNQACLSLKPTDWTVADMLKWCSVPAGPPVSTAMTDSFVQKLADDLDFSGPDLAPIVTEEFIRASNIEEGEPAAEKKINFREFF